MNRDEIRNQLLKEIIVGYDQLIDLFKNGGAAAFTGHAYDPKESDREVKLLEQLRQGIADMVVEVKA